MVKHGQHMWEVPQPDCWSYGFITVEFFHHQRFLLDTSACNQVDLSSKASLEPLNCPNQQGDGVKLVKLLHPLNSPHVFFFYFVLLI